MPDKHLQHLRPCFEHQLRNLTPARTLVGTPAYAPPERLRGDDRRDPRTDLYSLGVVLYEMLAGVRPFEAGTFSELARRVQNDAPPGLRMFRPDVPEALERVVMRALAKRADDRFANAEAFANALVPFGGRAVDNDESGSDSLAMDLLKIRARDKKREPTGQVALDGDSSELELRKLELDVGKRTAKAALNQPNFDQTSPHVQTHGTDRRPPPVRSTDSVALEPGRPVLPERGLGLPPPTARAMKQVTPPVSPALPRHVDAQGIPPFAGPELPRPGGPPPLRASWD